MSYIIFYVTDFFSIIHSKPLVGIGGGEYRSVRKKRRVEGEEVWSVQEGGSEKKYKKFIKCSKIFFSKFYKVLPIFHNKKIPWSQTSTTRKNI